MKRAFLTVAIAATATLVLLIAMVNVLAVPSGELPAPDPGQLVELPDGSQRTLGELVAPWVEPLDAEAPRPEENTTGHELDEALSSDPELTPDERLARAAAMLERYRAKRAEPPDGSDPFALAEWHRHLGRLDQAQALYLALPESHPQWARSRRRLAWDCFTKGEGEPGRGVSFANEALAADPFDGNSWQDAARVYAATLGLPVD